MLSEKALIPSRGRGVIHRHLIDEELLPLGRVQHLGGVARDQRVEEGVEARGRARARLGAEDAPEPLRLLLDAREEGV